MNNFIRILKASRGRQIIAGIIIAFFCLVLSAIAGEILHIKWLKKILLVVSIFPWFLMVARNLFFTLVDMQIAFHQKYNTENLHRAPVSWVIKNEKKIKKVTAIIWLAGALFIAAGIIINE